MPIDGPPQWMLHLGKLLILDDLHTGVIFGMAMIEKVTRGEDSYELHLTA